MPWSRLVAAGALVLVAGALYWVTSDIRFAVDPRAIPVTGAAYTGEAAVHAAMGLPDDRLVNIFRIGTGELERDIEELPAVLDATVTATLPDRVEVSVVERVPMLVWRTGDAAWLVDGEGLLFAPASAADPAELGTGATGGTLPAVDDRRSGTPPVIGDRVDPLDLEVLRLLLTITPEMIRSEAPELHLSMSDTDGYVLTAADRWRAVFGPYTPVLRPPSIIPRQVQCLDALLAGREPRIATITLAISDVACGTFQERAEPRATPRGDRRGDTGATPRPQATRRP